MSSPNDSRAPTQALQKPPGRSWRDHLCMLLHVGAEIEHALMVEYLYAAYSLGGDQVPEEHRGDVRRWQDGILSTAREEMGHLISVQNLLCLVGGAVSFQRGDYPFDTPYYPFPFRLEALNMDSLSKFIYAEMPLDMPDNASKTERRIRKAVKKRVEGEVQHPHPVAEIYGTCLDLVADPERIPDSVFRPETYANQASWDEWGKGYRPDAAADDAVLAEERKAGTEQDALAPSEEKAQILVARMGTRTEALQALRRIAAQGEAPHLHHRNKGEPSHFERFADVYEGFESIKGWVPTRNVAVNPTTLDPAQYPDAGTYIESGHSRTWAELFNLRYRMALTYLTHTFRLTGPSVPGESTLRGRILHRIFGEMYNMKTLAGILMRLPLTDDPTDDRRAGPPFEMPYTLALPSAEADCWRLHQDLLESSVALCDRLLPEAAADGRRYLTTLRDLDRQALATIDHVLEGTVPSRKTVSS